MRDDRKARDLLVKTTIDQIEHEHRVYPPVAGMWREVLYQAIRDAAGGDREVREYWWTDDFTEVCGLACVDPGRVRQMMIARGWGTPPVRSAGNRRPMLTLRRQAVAAAAG